MKKFLIVFLFLLIEVVYSQQSSRIANPQNFNQSVSNPFNLIGANPPPDGQWQVYLKDDIRWETYNINGIASYIQSFVNWSALTGKPAFATVSTSGDYNDLINKPTALSSFTNDRDFTTNSTLVSGLAGKENTITAGTTDQYYRGDKTFQILNTTVVPEGSNLYYTDTRARASNSAGIGISYNSTTGVITNSAPDQTVAIIGGGGTSVTGTYPNFTIATKRQVTYSGTTDASGNYTVTFSPAFSIAPNIQANIIGGSNTNLIKISSISTTGFTVNVVNRVDVIGLLPSYNNVNGASVDALITEK